ncbi:MAG: flagellar assembly protein FliW [Firmicutes bacterium]|nr:flagellar assembly protein FliW [Bacillota bacterium]
MELQTKLFGKIEYNKDEILHFPAGIFGFEEEHEFLLLPFEGSEGAMLCLQSMSNPYLAFIVLDPFRYYPAYQPAVSDADRKLLGADSSDELCYYVLCVIKDPVSESTVNLRCPVVIDPKTSTACQIIMEGNAYSMRHSIGDPVGEV